MSDELEKFYELLGVAPGVSSRELKQAYHDMAKVWHPDRFSHDPRLQQKAQEKLKEINEAYERLSSGRVGRSARTHAPASSADAPARSKRQRLIAPTATVVFCAAFFAALGTLLPTGAGGWLGQKAPAAQAETRPADEERRPDGEARPAPTQAPRGKERTGRQTPAEAPSGDAPAPEAGATQLRPMPTVTVTIDAVTGQVATRDCPTVSRMTYPAGSEPRQHCATPHKTKTAAQAGSKDSRLKAVGKRLAEPFK